MSAGIETLNARLDVLPEVISAAMGDGGAPSGIRGVGENVGC